MANDFPVATEESSTSVTSLVSGIASDVQDLLEQHLLLFRQTMLQDMRDGAKAVSLLVVGVCTAIVAAVGLLFAAARALNWAVPQIPLWASMAIVGGVVACIAGCLIAKGLAFFDSRKSGPTETAQAMKESVQCLKSNLKSS